VFNGEGWTDPALGFAVVRALGQPVAVRPEAKSQGDVMSLPPGWETAVSRSRGVAYYIEIASGRTQWEFPRGVAGDGGGQEGVEKQAEACVTGEVCVAGVPLQVHGKSREEEGVPSVTTATSSDRGEGPCAMAFALATASDTSEALQKSAAADTAIDTVRAQLAVETELLQKAEQALAVELSRQLEIEHEILRLMPGVQPWRETAMVPATAAEVSPHFLS
jgi:hypothetical protein